MSALFDENDKKHLYGVFQPNEHEYRVMYSVGKQKEWAVWSVYIKRDAIINRMNERFFGEWSSGFVDPQNPCIYHKDHVDCSMHFTIRGVRMEYNGSQSGTGENGAKGAATDAFKRVASQWGIGLYLQHAPEIFTKHPDKAANKQEKQQIESEVQNKITQWVAGLLKEQNKVVEISRPSNAEQPIDTGDDNEPDPQWIANIKDLTRSMYIDGNTGQFNPYHQNGSIGRALDDGLITPDMSDVRASVYLLMHRAEKDYGMNTEAVQAAVGGKVSDALGNAPNPDNFEHVWNLIRNEAIALGVAG